MNLSAEQWRLVMLAAAALAVVLCGIVALWRSRRRDPAELERRRRAYLNKIGRIVEGHVMEIRDLPPPPAPSGNGGFFRFRKRPAARLQTSDAEKRLVVYTYSISGVTYEAAQDVSGLEARACLDRVVAGQHISVKYDPVNPSNSILIADDWSGIH